MRNSNGEKKILWTLLETLIAFAMAAFVLATGVNAWIIKDYWTHKQRDAALYASLEERLLWQETTLRAIATELGIKVPPPPTDNGHRRTQ